jgi:hypothetical protein
MPACRYTKKLQPRCALLPAQVFVPACRHESAQSHCCPPLPLFGFPRRYLCLPAAGTNTQPRGRRGAGSAGISEAARLEVHAQAALQNTSFNDTQVRCGSPGLALAGLGACRGGVAGACEESAGVCATAGSSRELQKHGPVGYGPRSLCCAACQVGRRQGVEEDVEEHQDTNIACVAGTGQKMDRAQDAALATRGPR